MENQLIPTFEDFKKQLPGDNVSVRVTSSGAVIPPPVQSAIPTFDDFRAKHAAPESPSDRPTLSGFGGNVLSSGARMGTDIFNAVTSPVQAAKAVGGLALGLGEKLIPGEQGHEKNVDALVGMYKDRYGSWDNFTKTLYEDPVGVAADISTLAGGVGIAGKGLGLVSKSAKLAKAAEIAGTLSDVTDPLRLASKAVTVPLSKTGLGARLYESALKPSLGKKNLPKIAGEIQTGLREGLPVSAGGVDKLHDLVMGLQDEVKANIQSNAKAGATISAEEVIKTIDDLKKKFGAQVNPRADLRALESAKREFLGKYAIKDAQGNITGYRPIPVSEAQESKIATYSMLKDKAYGELKGASVEAQKALARGIKEELVKAIPELADLNLRESKLLQLEPILEHAVARIRNHQLMGIGTPILAGGVHAATGSTKLALAAGIVRGVIETPQIKSRLAIAINSLQKRNPTKYGRPSMATAISRVQEYVDSIGEGAQ